MPLNMYIHLIIFKQHSRNHFLKLNHENVLPSSVHKDLSQKNLDDQAEVLTKEIDAQQNHSSVDVLNTSPMVQEFKLCFSSA